MLIYIRWHMRRFMFLRCMPTIMATINSGEKIINTQNGAQSLQISELIALLNMLIRTQSI